MPTYNGFSVSIYVDGRPLPEYQPQFDGLAKEMTCWIPSQVSKNFSVGIRNKTTSDQMRVFIKMDGQLTNTRRVGPGKKNRVDRCRPSPTTYRTFIFSSGQVVDDDDVSIDASDVAGLGTIKLSVYGGYLSGNPYVAPAREYREIKIPEKRLIPERGKKGIQQCVGLGPVQYREPDSEKILPHTFHQTGHMVTVIFRYRPLAFLQAQGIVPPPDSVRPDGQNGPSVQSKKRKRVESSQAQAGPSKSPKLSNSEAAPKEVIELDISDEEGVEKLLALRASIDRAIAKRGPSKIKKEVKQEQQSVFLKGEVIDLT